VHSHPDPNKLDSYVHPAQFPKKSSYLDEYDGIILGHTHVQYEATIDGRLIVNPESVGQPRDRDGCAAYVILDTAADEVELRWVKYDINRVGSRVKGCGLPIKTGTLLLNSS
jgi:predicted phosphodiesterase